MMELKSPSSFAIYTYVDGLKATVKGHTIRVVKSYMTFRTCNFFVTYLGSLISGNLHFNIPDFWRCAGNSTVKFYQKGPHPTTKAIIRPQIKTSRGKSKHSSIDLFSVGMCASQCRSEFQFKQPVNPSIYSKRVHLILLSTRQYQVQQVSFR